MRARFAAVLFLVAGCVEASAEAPPGPPGVWTVEADGTAVHRQSGLRCPKLIDDIRRVAIETYDPSGHDVSCGYNSATVASTAYLTRGVGLDANFEQAKQSLMAGQAKRKPQLMSEHRVERAGLPWRQVTYALDGGAFGSDIWMTEIEGWTLKYRVTYPVQSAGDLAAILPALTETIQASAGATLKAARPTP